MHGRGDTSGNSVFISFSEFTNLLVTMGEVCYICGHRGFSNALLDCSECSIVYAHQYCLGIPPGTIDESFDWVCEYCSVPTENESCQKFEGRNEVGALPEELQPLCALPPIPYHEYSTIEEPCNLSRKQEVPMSSFMRHPDSIMQGIVLLVSPSGEVFIDKEVPISSFMEHPDSIMQGTVLLVSPSGEVFIDKERSFGESSYFSSVAADSYKEKREDVTGTIELHENNATNGTDVTGYTSSEIDGCEEKDDTPLLSASSKLDGLRKSFDYPDEVAAHITGSSMDRKGKRKRALEPEVKVIQQKKATLYKKAEVGDDGLSSEPVSVLRKGKRKRALEPEVKEIQQKKATGYNKAEVGDDGLSSEPVSILRKGKCKRALEPEVKEIQQKKATGYNKAEVSDDGLTSEPVSVLRKGKCKRALEPEVKEIQQKKATGYNKAEVGDDGLSSEPVGNTNEKHELMNHKTNGELSGGKSLAHPKRSVLRNQIVSMLLSAGWTVEFRTRKSGIRMNKEEKVYVSPQGSAYWSVPLAYRSFERAVMKAKAKKSENGDGSCKSNICFKPLPKEFLSEFSRDKKVNKLVDREES